MDIINDVLMNPKVMVYISFWIWLISTFGFLFLPMWYKKTNTKMSTKFNINDPVWRLAIVTITMWITMWCFRSLY
jgi:hypothetical protein